MIGDTKWGAYAEHVVVDARQLIALPDEVSAVDASCLPVAYGTAHRMMFTRGQVAAGESVFVLGASGGVGPGPPGNAPGSSGRATSRG